MASTQIATTTDKTPFANARASERVGNRQYVIYQDGAANIKYSYTDDGGVTWAASVTVKASASRYGCIVYDAANGRLEFFYAGNNGGSEPLFHRAITSNVATGTPGALTAEITIDAGGAGAGVEWVSGCISSSVTNPRIWLIAEKYTTATVRETRIWWCPTGTSADTAGNYTAVTNIGGNSNTTTDHMGRILYQKIGGNDKVFAVFGDPTTSPPRLECILFDPTVSSGSVATTISGATVNNFGAVASGGFDNWDSEGPQLWAASLDDYIVVGRRDPSSGKVDWYYSTNGTSVTAVTSGSVTAGRSAITTDGTDFHILHSDTYGVSASTDQTLSYRKLTKSSNTLGGASAFSDGNGNGIQVPSNCGTTSVVAVYRRGTASPYSIRADSVSISSDTTPPGQATGFTATPVSSGTEIDLSAIMPSDPDVSQYEFRRLSGVTFPASDRSNGTIIVAATATSAGATVTFADTGLTGGTVYSYRVFVRDASGNWNTGATVQATAATRPVFVARYKNDGVGGALGTLVADGTTFAGETPVDVFQCAASDFKAGSVAHFRYRSGTDNATPPTLSTSDLFSGLGSGIFQYETTVGSGTWTNVPPSGLPSAIHQRASSIKIRINTQDVGQKYFSLRREQ